MSYYCVYHIFIKFDLTLFFVLLKIYIKFKFHILLLRHFPNLKIVLVGHDILFPFALALACRNLKITTIALQDRMVSAWWAWPVVILSRNFQIASKLLETLLNALEPLEKIALFQTR